MSIRGQNRNGDKIFYRTKMQPDELKKYIPLFVAAGAALIGAIWYIGTGRGSLDNNLRDLEKTSTVQKVETKADNTVVITCKNGESYEIVYKPGQTDYQNLVYDKCGEAGELLSTQQAQ